MKQYPLKFKLHWDHIEWGQSEVTLNSNMYFYYFHWGNLQPKEFSFNSMYYDGPHKSLNLWLIGFSWSTPWTKI